MKWRMKIGKNNFEQSLIVGANYICPAAPIHETIEMKEGEYDSPLQIL